MILWLQANWGMILGVLWGFSEALALIPAVKANSVFQLIWSALKYLKGGLEPAPQVKGK
jgi:hypothetical protein